MREAIQIIQMLAPTPSPPLSLPATSPRQWRAFSVPWEWCQHGPLKTAAVRSEMNALAEHNGPDLNTTRIDARSEPQQKKEGYSAPIQPCCYFISRKFASTIYTFCRFQVLWSRKHVDELPGGEFPRFRTGFHVLFLAFFFVVDWNAGACVSVWPQIYTDWANHYLAKSGHKRLIKDLQTDVTDGVLLAEIIQVVGKIKTNFITKFVKKKNVKNDANSGHMAAWVQVNHFRGCFT